MENIEEESTVGYERKRRVIMQCGMREKRDEERTVGYCGKHR